MQKSLDQKLQRILNDPSAGDFILADAKDADMGFGIGAPGVNHGANRDRFPFRSLEEYRQSIRQITQQGLVDIVLMSTSVSERLTIEERIFDGSTITPAVRANDTTDIWLGLSGDYKNQPSLPFRTAIIDHIQCGRASCSQDEHNLGADLGLYSITFNNDAQLDREALAVYHEFRVEAEAKGFRHFLEVFAPNAPRQEFDRALPGGCPSERPAAVLEDTVLRSGGDGATGALRSNTHRRHPRRACRHDARRVPHAVGGEEVRRSRGAVRPQDQQR